MLSTKLNSKNAMSSKLLSDRRHRWTAKQSKVSAVVLDWAGTAIDMLSSAPAKVFMAVFHKRGLNVSEAEARGPMGVAKRDHIAALFALPHISDKWLELHGRRPNDQDIDALYHDFLPLQKDVLANHCELIPGLIETMNVCRQLGIKVGSTTGYTRELMDVVVPLAAKQGYQPQAVLCSDEVAGGRPAPWMLFEVAHRLQVYPMSGVVKIDDTLTGIEAGVNAGAWTVAVLRTGNAMALAQLAPEDQRIHQLEQLRERFLAAGAHYIIDGIGDLPPILEAINARLAKHESPNRGHSGR